MALFNIPNRNSKEKDLEIAQKSKSKTKATISLRGSNTLLQRIQLIVRNVENALGKFRDDYIVIKDEIELNDYITKCIDAKFVSIDTETDGLDPILNKIVGLCLYAPGLKAAYVPINHVSYITGTKVEGQLTESQIKPFMQMLVDSNTKVIMFNAKFDIRVIKNQIGVELPCYWDCYLGARCLNENEPTNVLKKLHQKYVLNGEEDAFTFDELFKGITFDKIPIDTAYLYAAHDAIITYELFKFQEPYLSLNQSRQDLAEVAWVFHNIEMECIPVVVSMEDTGIELDVNYANELSIEYHELLKEKLDKFYKDLAEYQVAIDRYTSKHINHKLDNPINIASPSQLATLFYDILHYEPVDKKSPRGTGVEILEKLDNPLAKDILEYRKVDKLINTYIDKLPNCVNPKDGRIHCGFMQYGAATGRMSSSDPNLQLWAYI